MRDAANWAIANELARQVDRVRARSAHGAANELAADLDAIRRLAAANGVTPAIPVIRTIEAALAQGQHGPALADNLMLLGDAVRCEGDSACAIFAAACAVRLAG